MQPKNPEKKDGVLLALIHEAKFSSDASFSSSILFICVERMVLSSRSIFDSISKIKAPQNGSCGLAYVSLPLIRN